MGIKCCGFYGRHHSEKTKKLIRKILKEKYGNKQTINKQIRGCSEYNQWREAIYKRDNYSCQLCNAHTYKGLGKTVKLEAHHKIPLNKIIKGMTFEQAIELKELFNLDNGITLCLKCHKKLHRKKK